MVFSIFPTLKIPLKRPVTPVKRNNPLSYSKDCLKHNFSDVVDMIVVLTQPVIYFFFLIWFESTHYTVVSGQKKKNYEERKEYETSYEG